MSRSKLTGNGSVASVPPTLQGTPRTTVTLCRQALKAIEEAPRPHQARGPRVPALAAGGRTPPRGIRPRGHPGEVRRGGDRRPSRRGCAQRVDALVRRRREPTRRGVRRPLVEYGAIDGTDESAPACLSTEAAAHGPMVEAMDRTVKAAGIRAITRHCSAAIVSAPAACSMPLQRAGCTATRRLAAAKPEHLKKQCTGHPAW